MSSSAPVEQDVFLLNDCLPTLQAALMTCMVIFIVHKILKFRRALKAVSFIPGFRVPFQPLGLPGALLPTRWWNPGVNCVWDFRDTMYRQDDTISLVPYLIGPPTLYTANFDVMKQIIAPHSEKSGFGKPMHLQNALRQFGSNVLATDGEHWKRHRRIMGPAFHNKLYEVAWVETISFYHDMVATEQWCMKQRIDIPAVQVLTFELALLVIGKCGFGFPFKWSESEQTSPTGKMTLREAFKTMTTSMTITSFVPDWMLRLPIKDLRRCFEAKQMLMSFMKEQVASRRADLELQAADFNVFSMLVQASEDEGGKFKLNDSELIGNVFILLVAGHETTAHSLSVTLGLLASHADTQEDIYQHIMSIVDHERDPIYSDYGKLYKVLAAFFESLRMFPTAHMMIRVAYHDTILQLPNPDGEGHRTVPIAKGTQVIIDMVGLHSNPRYFEEPKKFKPSRWYDVANESEAFTAFSTGNRICLGRKFATTEAVAFLTMILRDYRIEPQLDGQETIDQWKHRVLQAKLGLTLGVQDIPVRFVRRKQP